MKKRPGISQVFEKTYLKDQQVFSTGVLLKLFTFHLMLHRKEKAENKSDPIF